MNQSLQILTLSAASIGFLHTLTGPDHYLPFIVLSKARKWSLWKTSWITLLCGLGHVGSSVVLGIIGIASGVALNKLVHTESVRGGIVSWVFLTFGLIYLIWGIYKGVKNKPHKHLHFHEDGNIDEHHHTHESEHGHEHGKKMTLWVLFIIFVLGPCEPLIPFMMKPAADGNSWGIVQVAGIFSLVTIATMLTIVILAYKGFEFLPMKKLERYIHAIAGGVILICGIGMVFLGW
jgi:nickel/cobalt transporter (NicO) family protein